MLLRSTLDDLKLRLGKIFTTEFSNTKVISNNDRSSFSQVYSEENERRGNGDR